MTEDDDGATGPPGLRARKKEQTRRAIQEAALDLFAADGYEATTVETIAAKADVSTTTFFRYFASKEEVIFADRRRRQPALYRAILDRPPAEGDLEALRSALEEAWATTTDPEIVARQCRAVATSSVLRGRGLDVASELEAIIADALAERHLTPNDEACRLTASVAVSVLGRAVTSWAMEGRTASLPETVHDAFELLGVVAAEWAAGRPGRSGGVS